MNNQEKIRDLQSSLVDKILDCLDNSSSKEKLCELTESFQRQPEVQQDKTMLQSLAILGFLTHQIQNGNSELISQRIIQESCTYTLVKLLAGNKPMSL